GRDGLIACCTRACKDDGNPARLSHSNVAAGCVVNQCSCIAHRETYRSVRGHCVCICRRARFKDDTVIVSQGQGCARIAGSESERCRCLSIQRGLCGCADRLVQVGCVVHVTQTHIRFYV